MECIFECQPKYGGLLVHLDDTDRYDYHTKNPACTGEVVRCRDCKCLTQSDEGFPVCRRGWVVSYNEDAGNDRKLMVEVDPDGFCAWGIRADA